MSIRAWEYLAYVTAILFSSIFILALSAPAAEAVEFDPTRDHEIIKVIDSPAPLWVSQKIEPGDRVTKWCRFALESYGDPVTGDQVNDCWEEAAKQAEVPKTELNFLKVGEKLVLPLTKEEAVKLQTQAAKSVQTEQIKNSTQTVAIEQQLKEAEWERDNVQVYAESINDKLTESQKQVTKLQDELYQKDAVIIDLQQRIARLEAKSSLSTKLQPVSSDKVTLASLPAFAVMKIEEITKQMPLDHSQKLAAVAALFLFPALPFWFLRRKKKQLRLTAANNQGIENNEFQLGSIHIYDIDGHVVKLLVSEYGNYNKSLGRKECMYTVIGNYAPLFPSLIKETKLTQVIRNRLFQPSRLPLRHEGQIAEAAAYFRRMAAE